MESVNWTSILVSIVIYIFDDEIADKEILNTELSKKAMLLEQSELVFFLK